jgi:hypothetical protein
VENPINCNDALKSGVISDNSLLSVENIILVRFFTILGTLYVFRYVFQRILPEVLRIIDLVFRLCRRWVDAAGCGGRIHPQCVHSLNLSHNTHLEQECKALVPIHP